MKKSTFITQRILPILAGTTLSFSALAATVNLVDIDGDGVISAEEIAQAREARKLEALTQYDTDGNGELSRAERRVMKDDRYDATLLEFDADGDGELSRSERREARGAQRASMKLQLDVNQDGEVSEEERAGMDAVRAERGDNKGKRGGKRSKDGEGRHSRTDDNA